MARAHTRTHTLAGIACSTTSCHACTCIRSTVLQQPDESNESENGRGGHTRTHRHTPRDRHRTAPKRRTRFAEKRSPLSRRVAPCRVLGLTASGPITFSPVISASYHNELQFKSCLCILKFKYPGHRLSALLSLPAFIRASFSLLHLSSLLFFFSVVKKNSFPAAVDAKGKYTPS